MDQKTGQFTDYRFTFPLVEYQRATEDVLYLPMVMRKVSVDLKDRGASDATLAFLTSNWDYVQRNCKREVA